MDRQHELEKRQGKFLDALDVINEMESGDSRELKNAIRKEIDNLEAQLTN